MGVDRKVSTRGGGARQVGDLCIVEDGSERSDALVSDSIAPETASEGQGVGTVREWGVGASMGAATKADTGRGFERQLAYSSTCSAELPLMPSASTAPPSGPRRLFPTLRARVRRRC